MRAAGSSNTHGIRENYQGQERTNQLEQLANRVSQTLNLDKPEGKEELAMGDMPGVGGVSRTEATEFFSRLMEEHGQGTLPGGAGINLTA